MNFLINHKVLYDHQYGFREGRSTELALYTVTEKYYEASENNDFLVGVYLDLTRAFDTIAHDIL